MILRNVAIRHGRKVLTDPLRRSLTTETATFNPSDESASIKHSTSTNTPPKWTGPAHLHPNYRPQPPTEGSARQKWLAQGGTRDNAPKKDLHKRRHIKWRTDKLGSDIEPYYQPHELIVNPPGPEDVTLELLMASQSHLGHSTSLWNPMNQRYIYGVRQGVHIISLETTAAHLRRAAKVVEGVAYHGGLILFVGTRAGQEPAVVKAAELAKGCHLFERWTPGSITNGDQILRNCEIQAVGKDDEIIAGFDEKIAEWKALKPDLVVVLNPLENYVLLHECGLNNIPTIGVIDTDADPTWVTYPIPANDDSLRCIQVIAGVLGRAGESGQAKRLLAAQTGEVTWLPPPGLGKPYDEAAEKRKAEAATKKKREDEERKTLAERDQLNYLTGELEGAGPGYENSLHPALAGLSLSDGGWEKKLRESEEELRNLKEDEELGGLGLKMKELLQASENGELSQGDRKIVKKIKQLRDTRGVRDEDALSEEDESLVKTMEMEGAAELVKSMELAREMEKELKTRERAGARELMELRELTRKMNKELAREVVDEPAAKTEDLGIEMIDLLQASQMSELSDGDQKILGKLQRMRNARGVRDIDNDPWSEEEEGLVNTMEYARALGDEGSR